MKYLVCEYWDKCINKMKENCYRCIYNDYLNKIETSYDNYLEFEKVEYKEEHDFNEYL